MVGDRSGGKGRKVVDLAEFRRSGKQKSPPPPNNFPERRPALTAGGSSTKCGSGACLSMLDRNVEQVDRDLEDLLAIPSSLFRHGDMSFSTDSNKDISAVARHFLMGSAIPSDLPDFGICLTRRGNNLFCTVVSKKQKIIVHAFVKNVQGGASWEDLKFSLREARDLARLYEVNDKPVNFIVQGEARHVAI